MTFSGTGTSGEPGLLNASRRDRIDSYTPASRFVLNYRYDFLVLGYNAVAAIVIVSSRKGFLSRSRRSRDIRFGQACDAMSRAVQASGEDPLVKGITPTQLSHSLLVDFVWGG